MDAKSERDFGSWYLVVLDCRRTFLFLGRALFSFDCVVTITLAIFSTWPEFGQLYQMLGVKLSTTTHQSNNLARSPCTPRIPHSRAHVPHCASQAPLRFVDLAVRPDSRRKEFGVSNNLPCDRPPTLMQAITAWYYTPDISSSRNTTKTNLVNYVESASSTYAVQMVGSSTPLPSTKLLLLAQGTDVFVADLAWSFDGFATSQIDNARDKVAGGSARGAMQDIADVADRLVRQDGFRDCNGKAKGVLKSRFMPLDQWLEMVQLLAQS